MEANPQSPIANSMFGVGKFGSVLCKRCDESNARDSGANIYEFIDNINHLIENACT